MVSIKYFSQVTVVKSTYTYCSKNPRYNVDTTGNATIIIILDRLVMILAIPKAIGGDSYVENLYLSYCNIYYYSFYITTNALYNS
ncbi:hypothetical protein bsdcttw_20040 [Anaerocolumna chitinilytica]|uniref:Uncharacterized protein n=1 Tax=Anaerocolumna chitinilytica TaxID=1727145 RepID=A0A7I8DKJ5_9FIRM|nr:hypothetical protein bsdcttw_20040 [Anaerocolumna chitinilytica]